MPMPETTGGQQDTRFKRGHSGNPAGRPKGSRHKMTVLAEKLLSDEAEAIVKKVIEMAKAGDMTAARAVLDRVLPAMKGRSVNLVLPPICRPEDVTRALSIVIEAIGRGDITPDEAATISGVLEAKRRTIEMVELEARLTALEHRLKG